MLLVSLKRSRLNIRKYDDDNFNLFENEMKAITFHSSKGMDFPVVILINVNEGNFPQNHIDQIKDDEERKSEGDERQLLYVGMTRASELLYIVTTEGLTSRIINNIRRIFLHTLLWKICSNNAGLI